MTLILYYLIAAAVVVIDQVTKRLAVSGLSGIETYPLIDGVLHLTYVENTGAAFGMVKDSKHRTRAIATGGGEISVSGTQSAFQLLTRIQDEVHRFSVAYMHKKHKKRTFASELTQVEGIGEKLAQKLMLHFKTKDALLHADREMLRAAGIPQKTADRLYESLHEEET